jgi:hypothetical protein
MSDKSRPYSRIGCVRPSWIKHNPRLDSRNVVATPWPRRCRSVIRSRIMGKKPRRGLAKLRKQSLNRKLIQPAVLPREMPSEPHRRRPPPHRAERTRAPDAPVRRRTFRQGDRSSCLSVDNKPALRTFAALFCHTLTYRKPRRTGASPTARKSHLRHGKYGTVRNRWRSARLASLAQQW